ncbi:hypothetical protein [Aquirufa nivalisilvae]|uniref:hypothetical protein n=1 Tax=Aquirufa nivalisilvae TaxID=2516557 RepID=UPI0022A9A4B9|nr:hypothetical protein [Aquirufa nivalisilvae]MCZ2480027.1 hypothetical protein [Aquirufa nivalisilvae]
MSNPKYTPMQILRDNIKRRIRQSSKTGQLYQATERMVYREMLKMIQGDALGKPLLEQEYECLEQAYSVGIDSSDLCPKLDNYCETYFTIVSIENLQDPCKPQTIL